MYVPPLDSLLRALGTERPAYEAAGNITLTKAMFQILVRLALQGAAFNEAGYLRENPDVAAEWKQALVGGVM